MPPQLNDEISYLSEAIMDVNTGTKIKAKLIKVGAWLTLQERKKYHMLLVKFFDIFASSYYDNHGLDHDFMTYSLAMNDNAKLVQQKPRYMHHKVALIIKKDIQKYLAAIFIIPIDYSP